MKFRLPFAHYEGKKRTLTLSSDGVQQPYARLTDKKNIDLTKSQIVRYRRRQTLQRYKDNKLCSYLVTAFSALQVGAEKR